MQLQPDELLNSFLLRRIIASGITCGIDIHTIFTNCGNWCAIPRVAERFDPAFNRISYLQKTELIQKTLKIWKVAFSTNPLNVPWLTARVFFGHKAPIPYQFEGLRNFPIRFCPACFKFQLETAGFAWFKRTWSSSNYCKEHGLRFLAARCSQCNESAKTNMRDITSCLTGVCGRCGSDFWENATPDESEAFEPFETKRCIRHGTEKLPLGLPRFAPCIIWTGLFKFPWEALRAQFRNPERAGDGSIQKILDRTNVDRQKKMSVVEAYLRFKEIRKLNVSSYEKLLRSKMEKIEIEICFDRNRKAILPYYVLKARDCIGCTVPLEDCPMRKDVYGYGKSTASNWDFSYMS